MSEPKTNGLEVAKKEHLTKMAREWWDKHVARKITIISRGTGGFSMGKYFLIRVGNGEPCWLCDWDGDPGRTTRREHAIHFDVEQYGPDEREAMLAELRERFPRRTFSVEEIELKPWPRDVVLVVAATAETVKVDKMRGCPERVECRDCGVDLVGDSWSSFRAKELANGRPVLHLCSSCLSDYDPNTVDTVEDHR